VKVRLRSTKGFFGGGERQVSGRLQLWNTTARRETAASQLERLNSSMSSSSLTIRNLSQASIASHAPVLPPLSLSQESIALPGLTRASTAASRSSVASASRSSVTSPTGSSTTRGARPSILSTTARPTSVRTTSSSVASPTGSSMAPGSRLSIVSTVTTARPASVRTTKTMATSNSDDVGILVDTPDPPRLVFLLEDASRSQSLLVIDGNNYFSPAADHGRLADYEETVDGKIKINPDLCKCPGKKDMCQCSKAFLQSTKGDVRAMETSATAEPLNLASAGRHQGCEGMTAVKGLTLVTIEFLSAEGELDVCPGSWLSFKFPSPEAVANFLDDAVVADRSSFAMFFGQLQKLYQQQNLSAR